MRLFSFFVLITLNSRVSRKKLCRKCNLNILLHTFILFFSCFFFPVFSFLHCVCSSCQLWLFCVTHVNNIKNTNKRSLQRKAHPDMHMKRGQCLSHVIVSLCSLCKYQQHFLMPKPSLCWCKTFVNVALSNHRQMG